MNNNGVSLPQCILEEIGFEGLDGITLEGLWKRISVRFKLPHPLNARVSNDIWAFVQRAQCLSFYELEEEREPFKFFDRAEYIDPFFGSIDAVGFLSAFLMLIPYHMELVKIVENLKRF